jgi:thiol-disulfide isomerase/thioredoxin
MVRFLTVLLAVPFLCFAQADRKVEGKIIDKRTRAPVPFASISIRGTRYGTSSNAAGTFVITYPSTEQNRSWVLSVSSIGYETIIVNDLSDSLEIALSPSTIELKEVVVYAKDQNARRIVSKAFSRIKKNYEAKPFLYKSFYRHYCKDDTTYGRLIEAAVDVYKRKGHRLIQPKPGYKEEVRVTQLRRSFDNTNIKFNHQPISLYSVMAADPVSYQSKSSSADPILDFVMNVYNISGIKKNLKTYTFEFDGITSYDASEVFRIKFSKDTKFGAVNSGLLLQGQEEGILYIDTKTFAILRSEFTHRRALDTISSVTIYKKYNNKYFHQYTSKKGTHFYPEKNFTHTFNLELMTGEIVLKDFKTFRGKEPSKEDLLRVDYDSSFWSGYNILKATPLQENIVPHLQQDAGLESQYADYLKEERERYFGGKEDEENFNKHVLALRGIRPIYIQLWASWCEPCMKDMARAKRIFDLYKTRIAFIYLSLDDDIEHWRKAMKRAGLTEPAMKNYRIGTNSDAVKTFTIAKLPRYILVDKAGNYVNLNAVSPSELQLIKDFENVLSQSDK